MSERTLTDADVAAIADALQKRVAENFYRDLGRGVWGFAKKAIVVILLTIAAYGVGRSTH